MNLWLDDVRPMPASYDAWVKTYDEAVSHLKTGKVRRISFDNDLGSGRTGYDVAKFIAEMAIKGKIPPIGWTVHSASHVGRTNIIETMKQADVFWGFDGASRRSLDFF